MAGLFDGTSLQRPVTCVVCAKPLAECGCPRDAQGDVVLPADQTARVRTEKRRRGKVVTTITGLDPVASDLAELVKTLRQQCGAGGTLSAEGVVEVQGDHRERVVEVLRDLGYPVRGQ